MFYTHLYLQPTGKDFAPWFKHRDALQNLGNYARQSSEHLEIIAPYTKDDLLFYLDFCRKEVKIQAGNLDYQGKSGFQWLPFEKMELQFYNIRHLQQHIGELSERLGQFGLDIDWISFME